MEADQALSTMEHADGQTLFDRLAADQGTGLCATGCPELDRHVLLGGFERGCVVGISSEEETSGLLIALQTVTRQVLQDDSEQQPTAMIITATPISELVLTLRNVTEVQIRAILSSRGSDGTLDGDWLKGRILSCLERIEISRVFDFEGLQEVLQELDCNCRYREKQQREEQTSPELEANGPDANIQPSEDATEFTPPAIVLITHISSYMTSLFHRRSAASAFKLVRAFASRLSYMARFSPAHGRPLVLLLNKATAAAPEAAMPGPATGGGHSYPPAPPGAPWSTPRRGGKAFPEPTLQSIFDLSALSTGAGSFRTIKPSFGLVFAQVLHLHLLLTGVPRPRPDVEATADMRCEWAVEVLLDDMGARGPAEARGAGKVRKSRERRWSVVNVVDERGRAPAVVDASPAREEEAEPDGKGKETQILHPVRPDSPGL